MKLLKELDDVCQEKWVLTCLSKSPPPAGQESKLTQLYRLVHAGDLTDAGMAKALYGANTPPTDARYRTLKTRLKEVYLNAFLLREQEIPSYKTYDEAYQNGHRLLSIIRLLMGQRAFSVARQIAEQTFQRVKDFEIIPINQGLTDMLTSLYLGIFYNKKKFIVYSDLCEFYSNAAHALSIVTNYYRKIRNNIYAKESPPIEIGRLAKKYVDECYHIRDKYSRISHIQAMLISTEMIGCMLRSEHLKAIEVSLKGDSLLKQCKGTHPLTLSVLAITRIDCCIKLKNFNLGLQQLQLARKVIIDHPINELAIMERSIFLGLITKNYAFAYSHIAKVKFKTVKEQSPTNLEYWLLYEAAINLLLKANKIPLPPNAPKIRRFRPGAFINKVPNLSQNKAGTNIQIQLYQFLFLLIQGKRGVMIDRAEGFAAYARRHLKGPENIRNRSFFKLLGIIVKANFNRLAAMKKAKNTLHTLMEARDRINLNDTELVAYEDLWEIALEHLNVRKADEPELARLSSAQQASKQ